MTKRNPLSRRLLLALVPILLVGSLQPAEAGLLGGGARPKGSSGGLLSPAKFNCIYDDGYSVEIQTNTLQQANNSGGLLPPGITGSVAVLKGDAECTTTDGNSTPTAEGQCTFEFVYKLPNSEPNCDPDPDGGFSSKTYTLMCDDITEPSFVTGHIACEKGDLTFFDDEHPCNNELFPNDGLCGVNIGITPNNITPPLIPGNTCSEVFEDNPLFEITQHFVGSTSCGFDASESTSKSTIDFESGVDQTAVEDPITPDVKPDGGIGATASIKCPDAGDDPADACFYMDYGPPSTGFVGKFVDGCGDDGKRDTPDTMKKNACDTSPGDAEVLGFKGMTDEIDGPEDTDDVYITFNGAVTNPSIAIIDYRDDGGPKKGDQVKLSLFSDTDFSPEKLLGSWSYEVPCNNCGDPEDTPFDPDGNVVTLGPSDPEHTTFTNVRSASITYVDGPDDDNQARDVGLAWDNLMYFDVQTELGVLANRFCTAGNRKPNGDEAENFVPLDGSFGFDPDFDPTRDCSGTESEGTAQFLSEENANPTINCSDKRLTIGACEGGSNGNKQVQFSISGIDVDQLNPDGVDMQGQSATCKLKNGSLDCKATCTTDIYDNASEVLVTAELTTFESVTQGTCELRTH